VVTYRAPVNAWTAFVLIFGALALIIWGIEAAISWAGRAMGFWG
jgi:hypothetical protein